MGNVQKAATAVVNLLGADGQPVYSPFVVPEGDLASRGRTASCVLGKEYYELHWSHYRGDRSNNF
jgi:hypothetical protein